MTFEEQLIRDEGIELMPYTDSRGYPTFGIGTRLPITVIEAELLMQHRLNILSEELYQQLPWVEQLDDVRHEALLNMAYNMGVPRLVRNNPKMLEALHQGRWTDAAAEVLDGPWKDQVRARAQRISKQIETGVRQ